MDILLWIIFGGTAGWLASVLVGTDAQQGIATNILVGMLGALVGGFIMNLFNRSGITGVNYYSFFVAILGSVILLWLYERFGHRGVTHN